MLVLLTWPHDLGCQCKLADAFVDLMLCSFMELRQI